MPCLRLFVGTDLWPACLAQAIALDDRPMLLSNKHSCYSSTCSEISEICFHRFSRERTAGLRRQGNRVSPFLNLIIVRSILNEMEHRYRTNAGAVFSLKYHIVWCPKYRRPVLVGRVAKRCEVHLRKKSRECECIVHALNVMPDHVHLFVESDPRWSAPEVTNRLKGFTSHELRNAFPARKSRLPSLWSRSSYAGTIGTVSEETVKRSIEAQEGK